MQKLLSEHHVVMETPFLQDQSAAVQRVRRSSNGSEDEERQSADGEPEQHFLPFCSPQTQHKLPSMHRGYSDAGGGEGGLGLCRACGLMMTWMTKSFWILVSCSRVLSVSSFPEKNQRWWKRSMPSWACSCFFRRPMVSAMLALRRRSFPVDSRTCRGEAWNEYSNS